MKKLIIVGLSTVSLAGGNAQAQDGNIYAGLDGFASLLGTEKSDGSTLDVQNKFTFGGGFAGIVGYDFGQFRLEGEIGKHYHNAKSYTVNNAAGLGITSGNATAGKSNMTHYMVNAVIDIDGPFADKNIEPFIGAGLGLSNVAWNNMTARGNAAAYTHGSDNVFAYQAFAGFSVPVNENIDISLKYRYLGTNDANRTDRLGQAFKTSYDAHDFVLGFRYKFGARNDDRMAKMPQPLPAVAEKSPEPDPTPVADIAPAAPAPAPVIDRGPYSVYFDWDSSFVDTNARDVIRKALVESAKADQIIIKVDGYADRSGPTGYNDNLSFERANAVKETLIANGVDKDKILIDGHGERSPEVETDDGVRERRNRRVIIQLN